MADLKKKEPGLSIRTYRDKTRKQLLELTRTGESTVDIQRKKSNVASSVEQAADIEGQRAAQQSPNDAGRNSPDLIMSKHFGGWKMPPKEKP